MAKKKKSTTSKKGLSEGQAITIAVILFGAGLVAVIYALQYVIGYFFPNF